MKEIAIINGDYYEWGFVQKPGYEYNSKFSHIEDYKVKSQYPINIEMTLVNCPEEEVGLAWYEIIQRSFGLTLAHRRGSFNLFDLASLNYRYQNEGFNISIQLYDKSIEELREDIKHLVCIHHAYQSRGIDGLGAFFIYFSNHPNIIYFILLDEIDNKTGVPIKYRGNIINEENNEKDDNE